MHSKNGGAVRVASVRKNGRYSQRQVVTVLTPRDVFPIPDPQKWPADTCAWLSEMKADSDAPCLFNDGTRVFMVCEDAMLALGTVDVSLSEWSTAGGFPTFTFDPSRIDEIVERLATRGYCARVFEPEPASRGEHSTGQTPRAAVVDIAAVREKLQRDKRAIL